VESRRTRTKEGKANDDGHRTWYPSTDGMAGDPGRRGWPGSRLTSRGGVLAVAPVVRSRPHPPCRSPARRRLWPIGGALVRTGAIPRRSSERRWAALRVGHLRVGRQPPGRTWRGTAGWSVGAHRSPPRRLIHPAAQVPAAPLDPPGSAQVPAVPPGWSIARWLLSHSLTPPRIPAELSTIVTSSSSSSRTSRRELPPPM